MCEVEKIKNDLKQMLSEYRYLHSLRVAEEARKLADIYSCDCDKAYLVGLTHDIAKEFSADENFDIIMKYHLSMKLLEEQYHKILHAYIGAVVLREKYGFDEEACHAVACHAIGDIPMNILDKIIFVADKIEPGKEYDGIEEERRLAYLDINEALILCIENNHKKLMRKNKNIYPKSLEVLGYMKRNR